MYALVDLSAIRPKFRSLDPLLKQLRRKFKLQLDYLVGDYIGSCDPPENEVIADFLSDFNYAETVIKIEVLGPPTKLLGRASLTSQVRSAERKRIKNKADVLAKRAAEEEKARLLRQLNSYEQLYAKFEGKSPKDARKAL